MNTVMLNTVHLDGAPIIKKGSGEGGGVTINNQSKSVDIVENGTTEIVADSGYTGLGKVSVNVNVVSDNDIAETDAEVCRVFFNAGLCANENYITKEEAARITDSDMVSFAQNRRILTFNGFKYFTSITTLPDGMFNNSTLLSIELPEGLTSIGAICFMGTPLESIKIPSGVTSIGGQAFMGCVKLTKITSLATTAPNTDATAFGIAALSSALVGRNTYNTGENMLYVPAGSTGYDTGAWLDPLQNPEKCGFTIKYQGEINNQDKSIDIVDNGTAEIVADAGYTGLGKVTVNVNVPSSGGGATPKYTGHADVEGLKAIGWTDEDIAYYQEHGVNWNEEDDEYHKVTDDNKALYGVLTVDNIADYKERIVYLPKIDTSGVTDMNSMFYNCNSLVAIPSLDTSKVANMSRMFYYCYSITTIPQLDTSNVIDMNNMFYCCLSLVSIPQLDTSSVMDMSNMFYGCYSLISIPHFDTSKVTNMDSMFSNCYVLASIPPLDTSKVTNMNNMFDRDFSLTTIPQLNTSKVTNMNSMFYNCYSLVSIPPLDTSKVTDMDSMFRSNYSIVSVPQLDMSSVETLTNIFAACMRLTHANIKNNKKSIIFKYASLLSKESLLYLINNEAATSAITITLAPYAYTRLATDADVVAALNNHPNISLASA